MEIKYNQRQNKITAVLGCVMIALSILSLVTYGTDVWFGTWFGMAHIGIAFYKHYVPYVSVKDGYLKKDFGPKILLEDIVDVRRFAGDYIFKTTKAEIRIDRNAIDKKSEVAIDAFFFDVRDGKFRNPILE